MRPLSHVILPVIAATALASAAIPAAATAKTAPDNASTHRSLSTLIADFRAHTTPPITKAPNTLGAGYLNIAGKNHDSLTHFVVPSTCSGDETDADSDLGTLGFRANGSVGETAVVDTVCESGVPTSSLVAIDWTQDALNSATAKAGDHVTTYVNETNDQTFLEVDDQTDGTVAFLDDGALSSIDSQFLTGSLNTTTQPAGQDDSLSDFGKVTFSGTLLDGVDISDKSANEINQRSSGVTQAVAGSLNVKQDTFTVTWKAAH